MTYIDPATITVNPATKPAMCNVCHRWVGQREIGKRCAGSFLRGSEGRCTGTIVETPDTVWQQYLAGGGA